jgi:CDP-diacylglycerol--serine O-phosphatidyltransferase
MCLRLARFNVMIDDPNRPDWQKNYFTGMPAPAGAVTAMLPLYLHFLGVPVAPYGAVPVAAYLLACAFLTISTVPMFAGKTLGAKVPRHWVAPIFVLVILVVALVVAYPFEALSLIVVGYFATVPLSIRSFRALERADRARAGEAAPALSAAPPEGPGPVA